MNAEDRLPGGFIAEVVRIGDTVRRTPPTDADFVGALLRHLAVSAPGVAPAYLGTDERGRQVLAHVAGRVPWRDREEDAFFSDAALAGLARLVRTLHDACAGTALAGGAETVCHRDLSPKNTVYRATPAGLLPVTLLDWDLAGPGRRIEDVAFAGWHWATLGGDADPAELGRRCRLLCDGYDAAGDPPLCRAGLLDVMLDQIEGTWRGIAAGAERDAPGMRRLRAAGVVEVVRGWQDWLIRCRPAVEASLGAR
ncbi:aminoglycoside phosphotransferase family protein [Micromonospora sp. R77]|jgi:hypothetical protein|uniref:phosphotransferase n=1 Tax=Micromonospora sp. R77 TaxID=2925836 RepID=UPI001F61B059|nr:phosphotransferase [Micromonospora sp. R77]MCI4061793.1 aminoglycoside phosphotransferase family protein [Micromonospora sp. R77]